MSTYTMRGPGEAGDYIDRVYAETEMTKTEIIRRSVLLAKQAGLFSEARAASMDAGDLDASDPSPSAGSKGGGVHAGNLSQVEGAGAPEKNGDASQPDDSSGGENDDEPEPDDPLKKEIQQW